MNRNIALRTISCLCVAVFLIVGVSKNMPAFAATADEIRGQISEYNDRSKELEREIEQYEKELTQIGTERKTLQGTVNELDVSRKRLQTNIKVTQNKINAIGLQIRELTNQIGDKETQIERDGAAIASAIRSINEIESESWIEILLTNGGLDDFWTQLEALQRFQVVLRDQLKELVIVKGELESTKTSSEKKRIELTGVTRELSGQKTVLEQTLNQKTQLLAQTKSKESTYQQLLAEKQQAHEQFEHELLELESKLRITIDPGSIPPIGSGVLRWPFSNEYMNTCASFQSALKNPHCLTQYFGNTPFATANPQIYRGGGHNGVDFRAPTGTKIQAALSGVVIGLGNTDLQKGCYSYGKWVLVRHNNGLSTLYAHLSHISVSNGQGLTTGDLVGFSGTTGYSTGPHLHFTVYASQGVKIGRFNKSVNCKNVEIPIAPLDGYLNPLSYL